jgi:hypothetical protein
MITTAARYEQGGAGRECVALVRGWPSANAGAGSRAAHLEAAIAEIWRRSNPRRAAAAAGVLN